MWQVLRQLVIVHSIAMHRELGDLINYLLAVNNNLNTRIMFNYNFTIFFFPSIFPCFSISNRARCVCVWRVYLQINFDLRPNFNLNNNLNIQSMKCHKYVKIFENKNIILQHRIVTCGKNNTEWNFFGHTDFVACTFAPTNKHFSKCETNNNNNNFFEQFESADKPSNQEKFLKTKFN